MKRNLVWVIASALSVASFGGASAADLAARPYVKAPPPPPPVFSWTGFYIGINGGGGSAHNCWDLIAEATLGVVSPPFTEGCHDVTGGTVGGQIGYRWQFTNWVVGVEGQGNWADFSGDNESLFFNNPALGFGFDTRNRSRIDSFGLITGQVGYAWNNVLLYVKGGGAVTDTRYEIFDIPTGGLVATANNGTRWGGTVGAGVEVGFWQGWSVGVEYDHLFMGSHDVNFTDLTGAFLQTDHISQNVDMGLVRLNYRFNWGGPNYGGPGYGGPGAGGY